MIAVAKMRGGRRRRSSRCTHIKSNNPHLTGGNNGKHITNFVLVTRMWFIAPKSSSRLSRLQCPPLQALQTFGAAVPMKSNVGNQGLCLGNIKSLECMPGEGCSTCVDWSSVMWTCSLFVSLAMVYKFTSVLRKKNARARTHTHTTKGLFLSAFQL